MNEKPEALRLADDLRARIAYRPSRDSTQTLLTCDDAARCLEEQHAEIERLREALEKVADASMSMHLNAAHMATSLQGIAKAALRREET